MLDFKQGAVVNRRILLRSRPDGEPSAANFQLDKTPLPALGEGDILRRTLYLSLDPYMRGRMSDVPSYAVPVALGQPMVGGTVSQIVQSRNPKFAVGDYVAGYDGWMEYGLSDGSDLRALDPTDAPLSYALGVLGMPGLTAYAALLDIGKPKPGETVVVSAAAGAVGSVAGQIAKIKGCHVVGIAGTDAKCRFVTQTLGFDSCINYREDNLADALQAACPRGIDIYFDNVAGRIMEIVLGQINVGARIPLVGLISQYNASKLPPGPNLMPLLAKRATIQGFLVGDYAARKYAFLADMWGWLQNGQVVYQEQIVEGLENAPEAFLGLFTGQNLGKLLVRVSPDPTAADSLPRAKAA